MAIAFQCPYCKKAFKVKDSLAGKKANCTQCKKIITVPVVSAPLVSESGALESLASTVLTDYPNELTVVDNPELSDIPLECPFCFEHVKFPITLAGKQQPCPQCRRIIKVPALPSNKPKDWRVVEHNLTMARKDDAPAPEGAWGNVQKSQAIVSREALLEADVIKDRKALAAPDRTKWYIALGLFLVFGGGGGWWYMRGKAADDRRLTLVTDAVKATEAKTAPLPNGWSAAIQTAAGEFYIHEEPPDLKRAIKCLKAARSAAQVENNPVDKSGLLLNLALVQTELVGDDNQIDAKRCLPWEEAQKELRQTLQCYKDLPREDGWLAIEALTRRLGSVGTKRPLMSALAPETLPSEADRAEALACVALILLANGDPKADAVADEAIQTATSAAEPSKSPRVVALLVARKLMAQAQQHLAEPVGEDAPLANRLAWAEGLARTGDANDLARARKIALAHGPAEHQVMALVLVADAAGQREELEHAVAFVGERAKKFTLPSWALVRLGEACCRAKRDDLAKQLASEVTSPTIKSWLELIAVKTEMASKSSAVAVSESDDTSEKSAAQALEFIAIARLNTRISSGSDPHSDIDAWKLETARPMGYVGAALGLQDRAR